MFRLIKHLPKSYLGTTLLYLSSGFKGMLGEAGNITIILIISKLGTNWDIWIAIIDEETLQTPDNKASDAQMA